MPKGQRFAVESVFDEETYLVFGIMRWRGTARTLSVSLVLAMLLNLSAVAPSWAAPKKAGKISEASPPEVIQQLKPLLDKYQPQVSIVSPRSNEVLDDNNVSVKFNVKDLPLYKDQKLGLGPHLHVFLDDQPYQAVYDVSQPVVFKDLAAGTHTIRAFAGRPWHESFKNDGAFAQVTFHVFTKTPSNNPDPRLPLLTYSRPQATYGAEPILLDFYLTNAPLHIVAQEDDKDDVADWRVKVTVNGDSFNVDRWQPIYLKGFKPGKNWVQLEYVDEKGNPVQNVYNNTARVFNYEPNGQDTLSKIVRGEISFDQAVSIVDPNYKPESVAPTPEPSPIPVAPPVEEKPAEPEVKETPKPIEEAPKPAEAKKAPGGFFNRFKRSEPSIAPTPEASPEPEKETPTTIAPELEVPGEPKQPEVLTPVAPEVPATKAPSGLLDRFKRPTPPIIPPVVAPSPAPEIIEEPKEEAQQPELVPPVAPEVPAAKAPGGFFNRFKRPNVAPVVPPIPTEEPSVPVEEPQPEEEKAPEPIQIAPEVKETPKPNLFDRFKRPESKPPVVLPPPIPDNLEAPEVETPEPVEVTPTEPVEIKPAPEVKETPKAGFFDRFKRPESKPPLVLPSPTPIPDDLSAPEVNTPEPVEVIPTEPVEVKPAPEVKEAPKPSLFDRLKLPESKPKIVPAPEIETPAEIMPSEPESKSIEVPEEKPTVVEPASAPSDFEPQTELERRLGMPLKPRVSQPTPTPEPALSSESAQ
ncbi:FHA domain containing protein [Leptolyngbya sp. NIES-3755]|nr:FHA domain containing protein [Leptolyngbya sp. NIES-3755]